MLRRDKQNPATEPVFLPEEGLKRPNAAPVLLIVPVVWYFTLWQT
jgi:hypothetical protein